MGVKLELTISRAETIQPKQDEVIYSINWDNGKFDYDSSIYPVTVNIGKIITFETENPEIEAQKVKEQQEIYMKDSELLEDSGEGEELDELPKVI